MIQFVLFVVDVCMSALFMRSVLNVLLFAQFWSVRARNWTTAVHMYSLKVLKRNKYGVSSNLPKRTHMYINSWCIASCQKYAHAIAFASYCVCILENEEIIVFLCVLIRSGWKLNIWCASALPWWPYKDSTWESSISVKMMKICRNTWIGLTCDYYYASLHSYRVVCNIYAFVHFVA